MTSLRERLERKIANNAQIYKPHGLVNSWRINYCTGAHSLLPLVLELAEALKFYSLKSSYSCVDEGRNYSTDLRIYELDEKTYDDIELGTVAKKALQAIEKFVEGEK